MKSTLAVYRKTGKDRSPSTWFETGSTARRGGMSRRRQASVNGDGVLKAFCSRTADTSSISLHDTMMVLMQSIFRIFRRVCTGVRFTKTAFYGRPVVSSPSIFLSFSIPRLISAVADWMSAILPHMVWP